MIKPGEPWGSPTSSPPDFEVTGGDAALARAVAGAPGALVRLLPDATSDLARAVGLRPGGPPTAVGTALPVDALRLTGPAPIGDLLACNMCVIGTPPDRLRWSSRAVAVDVLVDGKPWFHGPATTVVIASGQFLRGLDVVPRGHPGDGKAEVQVYELRRRERRSMRERLATGAHLPHPRIRARTAGEVEVRASRPLRCEVDGVSGAAVSEVGIRVEPGAFRLLL